MSVTRRIMILSTAAALPLATIPTIAQAEVVAGERELNERYLAWLALECRRLAREMGNMLPDGNLYIPSDRIVNLSIDRNVAPSTRAAAVLSAAGVPLEPDPYHLVFGDLSPLKSNT